MTRRADELSKLKAALADQAEALLVDLFGPPTKKRKREWRWGRRGSISYRFDRGTFSHFEAQRGGSLLVAVMVTNGMTFAAAEDWAKAWLGDPAQRPAPRPRPTFDADAEEKLATAEAAGAWRAGRNAHATAAARNLQGRAIEAWPADCVRFIAARDVARTITSAADSGKGRKAWSWWRWPAMVFPLTNDAGDVTAVQLVALEDDGTNVRDFAHTGKLKRVRGVAAGSALRLPGEKDGPLVLAEGAETALSVWLATGYEVWATAGAIGRAPLANVAKTRTIIVARDDDAPRSPARQALRDAIDKWRQEGRRIAVAQPWPLTRGDKSDFNDALQADGLDAVRERIEAAIRPTEPPKGRGRTGARLELATVIGRTVADLLKFEKDGDAPAPFKVVRSTLGLGKTEVALHAAIDAVDDGHRAIYSVPTHRLATEIAERAKAMARKRGKQVAVRVWHGREAEDPATPGQSMCRDLPPVQLAQQAGVDVLKAVCAGCVHRFDCSYLAQRAASADLWIVPHALLFTALPAAMSGAAVLIIDEDFALDGFVGVQGRPALVALETFADAVTAGDGSPAASADINATLAPIRRQLLQALGEHPIDEVGEPLARQRLLDAGLTVDLAEAARKAEGRRVRDVDAIDATTRPDLMKALRALQANNVEARRAATLWGHIADLLADEQATASGRVDLVDHAEAGRSLRLFGLQKMGAGWRSLPALHLDATAEMDLLRLRVPHAELVADIVADEPHVRIHQIVGRTFGKLALEHGTAADDARRFAVATAAERGGRWLVVAGKDAAEEWRDQVPPYVELAHWGAVRGLDAYGDVAGLVLVGRWGVTPAVVERMASVLTGRAVTRLAGWFPTAAASLTAEDGTTRTVDADRHPDPTAEAVRRSLVEAELLQAIGRGRGVQRGPDAPLDVIVLGNTPLPVRLATLADWEPLHPDRAMLADVGAWLESAGDAAAVTGQTMRAIQGRRARARTYPCPYKTLLYGHGYHLAGATYQRQGPGHGERRLVFDPRRIPDPKAYLEARLGPLALFELDEPPPDPPAPSPPDRPATGIVLPVRPMAAPSRPAVPPPRPRRLRGAAEGMPPWPPDEPFEIELGNWEPVP